jgi:hypothetical protein
LGGPAVAYCDFYKPLKWSAAFGDEPAHQCRKLSNYDINYYSEFTFIPAKITVHFLLAYKLSPDLERCI